MKWYQPPFWQQKANAPFPWVPILIVLAVLIGGTTLITLLATR